MMRSSTSILRSWPARIRSRVTLMSASDGVGSPVGVIVDQHNGRLAFLVMAPEKTSRGEVQDSIESALTRCSAPQSSGAVYSRTPLGSFQRYRGGSFADQVCHSLRRYRPTGLHVHLACQALRQQKSRFNGRCLRLANPLDQLQFVKRSLREVGQPPEMPEQGIRGRLPRQVGQKSALLACSSDSMNLLQRSGNGYLVHSRYSVVALGRRPMRPVNAPRGKVRLESSE